MTCKLCKKITAIAIILVLLLCLLPLPQRISKTFCGVNTLNNESVDISLDMNYLRFLLLKDELYGKVTVQTASEAFVCDELHYNGQFPSVSQAGSSTHDFSGWYFNDTMYMRKEEDGEAIPSPVGFESLILHVSSDFDKILILHNAKSDNGENQTKNRYIGGIDEEHIDDAVKYFSGYYEQ